MIGLFGIGMLIMAALLLNWLTRFDIEDDFNDRERY